MADSKSVPVLLKHSPTKYLTPAEKHDETASVRLSGRMLRLIEIALADGRGLTAIKTQSEFLRWAVQFGLAEYQKDIQSNRLTTMWQQFEAHQQILKEHELRKAVLEILDSTRKEVATMEALQAYGEIPKFLRRVEANVIEMNAKNPNYWTRRVKDEFYRDYKERLKADRISNHPRDAEKE